MTREKKRRDPSFQGKLFWSLTLTTSLSLIICISMLMVLFYLAQIQNAIAEASAILDEGGNRLEWLRDEMIGVANEVTENETIARGLASGTESARTIYNELYKATEGHRTVAQFNLYDANGYGRFSTAGKPEETTLPINRGILYAAREADGIVWRSRTQNDGCRAAKALRTADGTVSGYLVIDLDSDALESVLSGLGSVQNILLLVDPYWRAVWSTNADESDALAGTLRARLLTATDLNTDEYAYSMRRLEGVGFVLVVQQPQATRNQTMGFLAVVGISMLVIGVVSCIFIALGLSRQLNEPVRTFREAMERLENGDMNTRIESKRRDEFGKLANSFDHMVRQLKTMMERLVQGQRELDETQIRMMQAQLNPHFLCNTLDTMKWMGKIHNLPEVAEISTDLADILRSSISTEEFIPLSNELDLIHRYVAIQRIRFPGKFECVMDIPPDLLDCIIPKLMLQPLVENAILHGLDAREDGRIRIVAEKLPRERIRITVTDNGCGISEEILDAFRATGDLQKGGRLGLYNVNVILKKHYGEDYGLQLCNLPEGGASVSAVLPITRKEELC